MCSKNNSGNAQSSQDTALESSRDIEIDIKDGRLLNLLTKQLAHGWKQKLTLVLVPALTFFGGMGAVGSGLWINAHDRRQQIEIKHLALQVERVRGELETKIVIQNEYNDGATEIRDTRHLEIIACELGLRKTPKEKYMFAELRTKASSRVIRTLYRIPSAYKDTPNLKSEGKKIITLDTSIKDVCNDTHNEDDWRVLQIKASNIMEDSIGKSNNSLKEIEKKLEAKIKMGWF